MYRSLCRIAKVVQASMPQAGTEASFSGRTWLQASCAGSCRQFRSSSVFAAEPALEELKWSTPAPQELPFTSKSRRTGVIAVKVGMTQAWDEWNMRIPLTVLWLDKCQVVQVKSVPTEGYTALQLGCGSKRDKQLNGRQLGHYRHAGVDNKRKLAEFRVSADAVLPVGFELSAAHYVPGQYLDIAGMTIGKGFQGVMKRHGFKGQPASHGNSLAHRAPGGIGACQDPGKVWPGKKMPGRMGNKRRTVQSVWVYKVDPVRNLLYVRGQVPGHKGNFVLIKDAVMKQSSQQPERPFPTYLGPTLTDVLTAPASAKNPFDLQDA